MNWLQSTSDTKRIFFLAEMVDPGQDMSSYTVLNSQGYECPMFEAEMDSLLGDLEAEDEAEEEEEDEYEDHGPCTQAERPGNRSSSA